MSNYPDLNKPLGAQQGGAYPPPGGSTAAPVAAGQPAGAKNYGAEMPQASERFANNDGWRDPVFAMLIIIAMLAGLGYTGYAFGTNKVTFSTSGSSDGSHKTRDTILAVSGAFLASCVILPYLFLTLIRVYAKQIIWASAIFAIILNFAAGALLFVFGKKIAGCDGQFSCQDNPYTGMAIMFLVLGLVTSLWLYLVKSRIPFASEMLSLSTSIIKQFPATIMYMYMGVVLQIIWFFCVIVSFIGMTSNSASVDCDAQGVCNTRSGTPAFVYTIASFLALWVSITFTNVMHVTTNGSVASWYFFAGSGTEVSNPTSAAFKRASTKSLGSVALGSAIIAIVKMLRASLRSARRNRNPFLMCCAYILLSILERVIEYITQYAFVYVAVYGKPFVQSAKCTMQLLSSRGIDAIVNDDLVNSALIFISLIFGLAAGGTTYIFTHTDDTYGILIALAIGFAVMAVCSLAADVVGCAIHTIFVCYAEDPAVLAETKPAVSERLTSAFNSHYPSVQLAPPARV